MLNLPSTSYRKYSYVSYGLASAIAAHPTLLESIPALNDASLYEIGTPLIFSLSRSPHKARLISLSEEIKLRHYRVGDDAEYTSVQLFEMIESILTAYRFEQDPFRD